MKYLAVLHIYGHAQVVGDRQIRSEVLIDTQANESGDVQAHLPASRGCRVRIRVILGQSEQGCARMVLTADWRFNPQVRAH